MTVAVVWPACGDASKASDSGCAGAEPYVAFDADSRRVVDRRESMHVAWASTAGTFESATTGRGSNERDTTSSNTFTAPSTAGTVHAWVVVRDDRGGVGWLAYDVVVD